jgi:hypothetical protein
MTKRGRNKEKEKKIQPINFSQEIPPRSAWARTRNRIESLLVGRLLRLGVLGALLGHLFAKVLEKLQRALLRPPVGALGHEARRANLKAAALPLDFGRDRLHHGLDLRLGFGGILGRVPEQLVGLRDLGRVLAHRIGGGHTRGGATLHLRDRDARGRLARGRLLRARGETRPRVAVAARAVGGGRGRRGGRFRQFGAHGGAREVGARLAAVKGGLQTAGAQAVAVGDDTGRGGRG